jgi:hypothetical protein
MALCFVSYRKNVQITYNTHKHRVKVFQKSVLKSLLRYMREEVTEAWKNMNEEKTS